VCEYLGELISVSEGNRRGALADLLETNYLYNLNDAKNIDAKYIGSHMKLVNNSFDLMTNCYARILQVRDSHRIALFASRPIREGEELFFDYGYTAEKKTQISWMSHFVNKYFFNQKVALDM